jgi:hypothetical protein
MPLWVEHVADRQVLLFQIKQLLFYLLRLQGLEYIQPLSRSTNNG